MKVKLSEPVYDRDENYESSSRSVRWICLALVLITYPFTTEYGLIVLTLVVLTGIYNALRYSSALLRRKFFSSRLNSLAVDHIFVLALVVFSGGLASPYYPFFFLLIVAVIASYGISGFAFSLSAQLFLTLVLLNAKLSAQPSDADFQFIIKLVFLVVFSLTAEQSVRSRDEEYLLSTRFTHRIENERQRLLSLINSLSNAVLALDSQGQVYLYNAAALELLNTNEDITGKPISALLPLHDKSGNKINILKQIEVDEKVINRQDLNFTASDGSKVILDLTVSPVHALGYGNVNWGGYMVVFRDITKQKSLDEERDEFISVTSHELRTPLAIAEANISTALLPRFAKIPPKALNLLSQAHDKIYRLCLGRSEMTSSSRKKSSILRALPSNWRAIIGRRLKLNTSNLILRWVMSLPIWSRANTS
jgi:two-component system, OmpR family, phosphate regulon sensor histidine kinase PhoR